jgi:hypothetical protein
VKLLDSPCRPGFTISSPVESQSRLVICFVPTPTAYFGNIPPTYTIHRLICGFLCGYTSLSLSLSPCLVQLRRSTRRPVAVVVNYNDETIGTDNDEKDHDDSPAKQKTAKTNTSKKLLVLSKKGKRKRMSSHRRRQIHHRSSSSNDECCDTDSTYGESDHEEHKDTTTTTTRTEYEEEHDALSSSCTSVPPMPKRQRDDSNAMTSPAVDDWRVAGAVDY